MESSPLLAHRSPDAIVAYRDGTAVTASQFLADAVALATLLPPGRHVLNVCLDRYRFTVGLAACLMTQRVSLLPSTHTPEVIRQLRGFAADVFCLTDEPDCTIDMPRVNFPADLRDAFRDGLRAAAIDWTVPKIPLLQTAAIVFTSGSTGTPLPYTKTWGRLSRCVRDGAPRLGLDDGRVHTLIGTVPAQHMYGFESTVLLALLSGNAFSAGRPFYPADICSAVAAAPEPRALISTPVHLRALLAAGVELPAVDLIVSATAPLDPGLARDVEARFKTRLLEIYGSTETGQIATRRSARTQSWKLWPGVRLSGRGDEVFAQGGHVEQTTVMCDVIEITGEDEFLLHGRTADLVNVAGKRSSFAYLNAQLQSIPGVVDGAFFLREADNGGSTGVSRLAAVVVAPTLDSAQLTEQLRLRIDPVFLPRPLLLVEALPRNATGKLPLQALMAFAEDHAKTAGSNRIAALTIPPNHPAYAGHFPGRPILPGAVLLDAALDEISRSRKLDLLDWQLSSTKFIDRVAPGDPLLLEHTAPDARSIRFTLRSGPRLIASGSLSTLAVRVGGVDGT